MYVRQPDQNRQRVKIPENYSGHAFREPSIYGDMPPPTRLDLPPVERSLPPLDDERAPEDSREPIFPEPQDNNLEKDDVILEDIHGDSKTTDTKPSIFSSLLPASFASSSHFPFGHGIGSEELLILAMMLMVFLSDKNGDSPDHELLLLLGLLLFAG